MENMNLREKIGQMIMTGFPSSNITPELIHLIEEYKLGNIILFAYNVLSIEQISSHCAELHRRIEAATGYPAFISIDQEGGVVTRLPKEACNVPGAMLIGATGRKEYAYRAGYITGAELKSLGINMDLAPVLDVNSNPNNPVIGTRSYSGDATTVEKLGIEMMKGLEDAGVMPTGKHFPGHGDTAVDSHLGLPVVDKDIQQLMEVELVPFIRAIKQGVPCIMTSHILFPKLESENVPATMSKSILTGLLREQLGFEGIIITDCLEMGAIVNYYGTAKGAVEAIKAGAQLLCISHTPDLVKESIRCIEKAVLSGEIPMKLIDDAVRGILKFKEKYRVDDKGIGKTQLIREQFRLEIEEMMSSGITKVTQEELPTITEDTVVLGCYAYRSTLVSSPVNKDLHFAEYLAGQLNCSYMDIPLNPKEEEIDQLIKELGEPRTIVYGLYNAHMNQGQLNLANKLKNCGYSVIAATLRNPYDLALLEEGIHKLAVYEYNREVFDALLRILKKEATATGILPVELT